MCKAEQAGPDQVRELAGLVVESHDLVVIGLTGKANAVFGTGDLFAQALHLGIGLEFRVGFCHHHQTAQTATQCLLGRSQRPQCLCLPGMTTQRFAGLYGLTACPAHCFQRAGFVLHVATCDFHQIGDQVMTALELHIDL